MGPVLVFTDGTIAARAADNQLIPSVGGMVGILVHGPMHINVRRFTVFALSGND